MPEAGTVIDSRYEIIRKIGEGGTSSVYLAADRHVGRRIAMKILDRKSIGAYAFARTEIESLRRVKFPLFPSIHDAFSDKRNIYIVSDYVAGSSLWSMCRGRGMPREQSLRLAASIIEALVYLHDMKRPILYLDLKPENVIVSEDGLPHLIDFGIAGWLADHHIPVGTIGYSPPEQYMKDEEPDERADIYAFGMTYYAIRHGRPPDRDPQTALYDIRHSTILCSSEKSFLIRCCAISREDRFSTADEVRRQIDHIRSIPGRIRKIFFYSSIIIGISIACVCLIGRMIKKERQNEAAAKLVAASSGYMEEGSYTPEGLGVIRACINSGTLSEECEQEFIFELAMGSMLVSHDYRTAAAYFSRLDRDRYREVPEYIELCNIQSRFDYDPETAENVTGRLFADIVKRAPSKMKYENMIFIAGCYENYDPDPEAGLSKALSVLKMAKNELDGLDEYQDMKDRIGQLITVKEEKIKVKRKIGERHE